MIWIAETRDQLLRRIFVTEDDAETCAEIWRSMGLDVVVYSAIAPCSCEDNQP